MDFPGTAFHKPVIGTWSLEALGLNDGVYQPAPPSSTAHPAANRAIFYPFTLSAPYLVTKVWWANAATATGNVDVGVYSRDGTLLLNAGTTAQTGTNVIQSVTLGTAVLLLPDSYYMALEASSASATFVAVTTVARALNQQGVAQQAVGSMPLPATFTLAAAASSYLPTCGIANAAVI